jgi:hypothetical protein
MAEEHDRLGAFANPDLQVVAPVGPPMSHSGDPGPLDEEVADLVSTRVGAGLVEGRRLSEHEALQGGEHGGPVGSFHQGAVHATRGKSRDPDVPGYTREIPRP